MSKETETMLLKAVLEQYATPDPKIVGYIQRSGINLAYVSHAEITRILIEIDPMWNWQPAAWIDGKPAIQESNGMATMWGSLTLLGKTLIGVGSVRADKPDYEKELVGDFLRNAAMRFGICLALWSKQDWETAKPANQPKPITEVEASKSAHPSASRQKTSPQNAIGDETKPNPASTPPVSPPKIGSVISDKQKGLISALGKEVADGNIAPIIVELFNKSNLNTLTTREASDLIKHLMNLRKPSNDDGF